MKKRFDNSAQRRVDFMVKDKINWFMGTICPAPKDPETGEIESVRKALEYYAHYTYTVCLQTKWMGSYMSAYLEPILENSRFFSRNGYLIRHLDREKLLAAVLPVWDFLFSGGDCTETIIVEGELLPWSVMGEGLIEREYGNYLRLHQDRLNYLKNSDLKERMFKSVMDNAGMYLSYVRDPASVPSHIRRQYSAMETLMELLPDMTKYESSINLYKRQYEIFGKGEKKYNPVDFYGKDFEKFVSGGEVPEPDPDWSYMPFNILKIGDKVVKNNNILRDFHHKGDFSICDVMNVERAYEFYESRKSLNHEGIVIKPLLSNLIGIPPAFKVRTNAYLQLIYGVNFDSNYDYYMEKRRIGSKLKTSISDYETGLQLLNIPADQLHAGNDHYVRLLYKAIDSEQFVKTLDSRL